MVEISRSVLQQYIDLAQKSPTYEQCQRYLDEARRIAAALRAYEDEKP